MFRFPLFNPLITETPDIIKYKQMYMRAQKEFVNLNLRAEFSATPLAHISPTACLRAVSILAVTSTIAHGPQ